MSTDNQNKKPILRLGILFFVLITISVGLPILGVVISIALVVGAILFFVKVIPKSTGYP